MINVGYKDKIFCGNSVSILKSLPVGGINLVHT